ncbi:MAG: type II secretion system protein [Candidatus Paceibacterota bacterium]|jgi:prepilin-type N-terminal cleavage/methylation domain-containing protein
MRFRNSKQSGLSFIELIVVVAIMGIISTIVLFRQARFSSDILITDMAYQIALAIRQAEVYGISSKQADTGSALTAFKAGYGVLFSPLLSQGTLSENGASAFALYIDTPLYSSLTPGTNAEFNYVYNPGVDVLLDPYPVRLTQGQKIREYCGRLTSTGAWQCWSYADPILLSTNKVLTITFVKPNPEAHIRMGTSEGSDGYTYSNDSYDKAKIVVESSLGDKCRSISVSFSGEISVDPVIQDDPSNGCDPVLQ